MHTWQNKKLKGSALLTALFIMTLVAIAATAMTLRLKVDIAKMQITIEANEFSGKAQLPMLIGMQWLLQSPLPQIKSSHNTAIVSKFSHITNDQNWKITGEIIDLQSRFNINNVENKDNEKMLGKLLTNVGLSNNHARQITQLCHFWTQPHRLERGRDKLLNQFLEQKPPYYPGFQPFVSPSELRLIPGINSDIAKKIMPLIIALPNPTRININTAPPEIIKILGNGLTNSQVNRILALRSNGDLKDSNKLNTLLNEYNIPHRQITVESNYFLIVSKVSHLDNSLKQFIIVERKKARNKKKVELNVIYVSYHSL